MFQVSSELAVYDERHKSQKTGKYIHSYRKSELPFITMSGKLHDTKWDHWLPNYLIGPKRARVKGVPIFISCCNTSSNFF